MPISMEQWRASVGSNNAARARVFSKTMNKCSSGSFLSQLLTYILALFTLSKRSSTGKGIIFMCVHVCMRACMRMYIHSYVCMYVYTCVCMFVCAYIRKYIHKCVCMYSASERSERAQSLFMSIDI